MLFPRANYMAVMAPLRAIAPLTRNVEDHSRQCIPAGTEALALLPACLRMLRGLSDPHVIERSVTYVYDLMALALGATPEAAAIANTRGIRAARLNAVKSDIAANLATHDLSVTAVALRQRVTPRYIHMLFEGEGTTFSQFVLAERLASRPPHAFRPAPRPPVDRHHRLCQRLRRPVPFQPCVPPPLWGHADRGSAERSLAELADVDEAAGDCRTGLRFGLHGLELIPDVDKLAEAGLFGLLTQGGNLALVVLDEPRIGGQ